MVEDDILIILILDFELVFLFIFCLGNIVKEGYSVIIG